LEESPQGLRINIDGEWRVVGLQRLGDTPRYVLTLDNRVIEVLVEEDTQSFNVLIGGRRYEVETARTRRRGGQADSDQFQDGKWHLLSPLTGVVIEVRVKPGDVVQSGDVILVIEAMKMLNDLRARVGGIVTAVPVAERDRVEIGQRLVEISEAS
jgi:oxaloacetate decarboxylase alpha subunit